MLYHLWLLKTILFPYFEDSPFLKYSGFLVSSNCLLLDDSGIAYWMEIPLEVPPDIKPECKAILVEILNFTSQWD
jgi:hypothetical protein